MTNQPLARYDHFRALGQSGATADVDFLMGHLHEHVDFTTTRLVDFALGLVDTLEGAGRIRHYLFHGGQIQRNYAALYFKRRDEILLLNEAVAQGRIQRNTSLFALDVRFPSPGRRQRRMNTGTRREAFTQKESCDGKRN